MNRPIPIQMPASALSKTKVYANRGDALALWPENAIIAELGVGFGGFTSQILSHKRPARFDAYDLFNLHTLTTLWGKSPSEIFGGKTQRKYYEGKFTEQLDKGILNIIEGDSSTKLLEKPRNTYDVIYIDGDHSLAGAARDTEAALHAVKQQGILVFNDYVVYDKTGNMYGVVHAVNDLCANHGWEVLYLALQTEMFCDIALVRS